MPAKYTYDVVATIGKYKDSQTGEERKSFLRVGAAFTDDEGRISIKLDAVPVTPDWSGWLSLFVPRDKQETATGEQPHRRPNVRPVQQRPAQKQAPPQQEEKDGWSDESIPF